MVEKIAFADLQEELLQDPETRSEYDALALEFEVARKIIEACDARGIECLTLFAFSTENWGRPKQEVGVLMDLFLSTLRERMDEFHERGARLRFIGDRSSFAEPFSVGCLTR